MKRANEEINLKKNDFATFTKKKRKRHRDNKQNIRDNDNYQERNKGNCLIF